MSLRGSPRLGFWQRLARGVRRFMRRTLSSGSYDAARTTRSRASWTKSPVGPNALSHATGATLRARARDLVRNDAHCARAIEVLAGSIVGTGIEPRAIDARGSRRSTALQTKADALWAAWSKRGVADVEGQHTLQALCGVAARAWVESGEVFVRRIFDPTVTPVPLRLQVLEADMLDDTIVGHRSEGGNRIEQGIELDAKGRRVAYHFRTSHPGETNLSASASTIRVPASDVIHLFLPLRPGQLRGVPFLAPVMAMKRDLADFEEFELLRKKTESMVVAFVTPGDREIVPGEDEEDDSLAPTVEDANGDPVGVLKPGAILSTPNGKDIRFNSPQISGNYDVYKRSILQSIAVGLQLTYEHLTGDLSNVTYTSYRAGHIQFNAYIDRLQWNHFIAVVMDTLWDWAMSAAYLVGEITSPDVAREWATPKRISVDPGADAVADIIEVRAGLALLADKMAERGYQPAKFIEQAARMNEALDIAEMVVDSDPRRMAFRGAFPPSVQGTAIADEAPPPPPANEESARKQAAESYVRRMGLLGPSRPMSQEDEHARERAMWLRIRAAREALTGAPLTDDGRGARREAA